MHQGYFFIAIFVVLILELILSASWSYFYFKTGIPLFKMEIPYYKSIRIDDINIDYLTREFSGGTFVSIDFKKIAYNEIGFRERLFQFRFISYTPLMHGRIILDDNFRKVIIKGQSNWYVFIFLLLPFVFFTDMPFALFHMGFIVFLVVILVVLYLFQVFRYRKVGRLIERMVGGPASSAG